MATAGQVVRAGLQSIIVAGAEAEIEPVDAQDFIFAMNNYMFALAARGVNVGYTEVSNLSDPITVPTGALRGMISNVAIEVSPQYGGVVSNELIQLAKSGLKDLLHLGVRIGISFYPSNLPIGSGNEGPDTFTDRHFFPEREAEILAEVSGAIGLEVDTEPV